MVSTNDLTLADIKFLQAVKDINKHPENYQDSDKGELPANSKSIRKATDLNSNQVSYRMGGNSSSKGFAEGDNPLTIPHKPVRNENGFGPRSVELTSAGVEMLDKAQNQINEISGIKRQEFNELKSKAEVAYDWAIVRATTSIAERDADMRKAAEVATHARDEEDMMVGVGLTLIKKGWDEDSVEREKEKIKNELDL